MNGPEINMFGYKILENVHNALKALTVYDGRQTAPRFFMWLSF